MFFRPTRHKPAGLRQAQPGRTRPTQIAIGVFVAILLFYALWAFKSLKDNVSLSRSYEQMGLTPQGTPRVAHEHLLKTAQPTSKSEQASALQQPQQGLQASGVQQHQLQTSRNISTSSPPSPSPSPSSLPSPPSPSLISSSISSQLPQLSTPASASSPPPLPSTVNSSASLPLSTLPPPTPAPTQQQVETAATADVPANERTSQPSSKTSVLQITHSKAAALEGEEGLDAEAYDEEYERLFAMEANGDSGADDDEILYDNAGMGRASRKVDPSVPAPSPKQQKVQEAKKQAADSGEGDDLALDPAARAAEVRASEKAKGARDEDDVGVATAAAVVTATDAAAVAQAKFNLSSGHQQPVNRTLLQDDANSGVVAAGVINKDSKRLGRSCGNQLVQQTTGGTMFTWGLSESRLGRSGGDASTPQPAMPQLQVISIAGSRHAAFVTATGEVWTMGHNNSKGGGGHGSPPMDQSGQLGRGGTATANVVTALQGKFVVQVITGRYHTMAVTDQGELYSWGLNDWGQLGRQGKVGQLSKQLPFKFANLASDALGGQAGDSCSWGAACHDGMPGRVQELAGKRIVAASAGRYNSLALDDQGVLYSWGYDGCGNGGQLPARSDIWKPRAVRGELEGKRVVGFDSGYVLWVAMTDTGDVYTCNTQDDGYAGTLEHKRVPNEASELGRGGDSTVPGRVVVIPDKVVAVAAGRDHCVAATDAGHVYTWGGRQSVLGREGDVAEPARVFGDLQNDKIIHVAAGEYFSLAASAHHIYGWGSNGYRALGLGAVAATREVATPTRVAGPLAAGTGQVVALAAGFQHAMAIVIPDSSARSLAVAADGSHTATGNVTDAVVPAQVNKPGSVVAGDRAESDGRVVTPNAATLSKMAKSQTAAVTEVHPGNVLSVGGTTATVGGTSATVSGDVTVTEQPLGSGVVAKNASDDSSSAKAGNTRQSQSELKTTTSTAETRTEDHIDYARQQVNKTVGSPPHVADIWSKFAKAANHEDIVAMSPDVFATLETVSFDKKFKNPCWYQGTTLRCIPYFHIIGVSKCGTTDLYHRLSMHPDMFESKNKGPHWYDECPWPLKGACTAPPNGDFEGYIDLYANAAAAFETHTEGITGEASSNTFTSARGVYLRGPAWNRDTRNVTIVDLMHESSPWLKLLLIFRDPVARYFSAFYYYRWWRKDEPAPGAEQFHKTALEDVTTWNACVNAHGHDYCVRHYSPQQLVKGMYSEFLGDWLRVFPRDQLLILRNEDYKVAQEEHMRVVFNFLGMRDPGLEDWKSIMSMPTRNSNSQKYERMLPKTKALLEDFYRPYNKRLAGMLNDGRFLWQPDVEQQTDQRKASAQQ